MDFDWASDTFDQKSVTGIIIKYAGGTIYFKSNFQETIAMSSTNAEFTAACDAGKAILYIRSIIEENGCTWDCDVDCGSVTELGHCMFIGQNLLKNRKWSLILSIKLSNGKIIKLL